MQRREEGPTRGRHRNTRWIFWRAGGTIANGSCRSAPASDDSATLAREVRAIQEVMAEHPQAVPLLLVLESGLPQPAVPAPMQVMPAW